MPHLYLLPLSMLLTAVNAAPPLAPRPPPRLWPTWPLPELLGHNPEFIFLQLSTEAGSARRRAVQQLDDTVEKVKPFLQPADLDKTIIIRGDPREHWGDSYDEAHVNDEIERPTRIKKGQSYVTNVFRNLKKEKAGARRSEQTEFGSIFPTFPHIHPSVQPLTTRPQDLEKSSGADYLTAPPDPMPPQPPYLYPPGKPNEFEYSVPPQYQAFYPKDSPPSYPDVPATCMPVKDLPFIRTLSPAKYMDNYCVPMKYLPFYHPSTWRMYDGPGGPGPAGKDGGGNPAGSDGPFFVAPPAPPPQFQLPLPFSSGPRFPAFSSPDGAGAPPPGAPPPPPANYPVGHLANKVPPLPPPPLPPPMWPYG